MFWVFNLFTLHLCLWLPLPCFGWDILEKIGAIIQKSYKQEMRINLACTGCKIKTVEKQRSGNRKGGKKRVILEESTSIIASRFSFCSFVSKSFE